MISDEQKQMSKIIGARIREARHIAGMSQMALGIETGNTVSEICNIENGQRSPRAAAIPIFANALKQKPGFFFSENESADMYALMHIIDMIAPTQESRSRLITFLRQNANILKF